MNPVTLSLLLGLTAAAANIFGGAVIVRRAWEKQALKYFVALGAGFMLATSLVEMVPQSLAIAGNRGGFLVLIGYLIVHFFEHTVSPHFHYGEETHHNEFVSRRTGMSVLAGLSVHALFDGVAIGSGFVVSNSMGWLIFLAIFLHKAPEGFTMASVMLASGRSRSSAFHSAVGLAAATLAGVGVIELVPTWLPYGLPISAGVALYVGASDLVPEVNREPGIRMALVFFAGVGAFLLLRMLLPQV